MLFRSQARQVIGEIQRHAPVAIAERLEADPHHFASRDHGIEVRRVVALEARGEGLGFEDRGRQGRTLQLLDHVQQGIGPASLALQSLPRHGKAPERRLFDRLLQHMGLTFSYVDTRDPQQVEDAMTPATRGLIVETPTNPLMWMTDLEAMHQIAARHQALLVVDNTFLSPAVFRPLEHGADMVAIGRGAILHHDFPRLCAADPGFAVRTLPVPRETLRAEGLSDAFIGYMGNWKGFVAD